MTTTDTDALTERIARALMAHECDQYEDQDECMTCDSSMVTCSHPPFMYCVEHDTTVDVGESCPVALERAVAVLPIIAVEVRKAKAEALRDAKGRVYASSWWADGSDNYADRVRGFLGTLAAEYEAGDSDEHR